jgi:hypothetical protein
MTEFIRFRHWSISWTRRILSIPPHQIYLRSVVILSSHLRPGLPSGVYPPRCPPKTINAFLFACMCDTCSAHLTLLDLIDLITFGEEYKLWSFQARSFPQPPIISSLFGLKYLVITDWWILKCLHRIETNTMQSSITILSKTLIYFVKRTFPFENNIVPKTKFCVKNYVI